MSALATAIDESRSTERRRAFRALLARPVLAARGPTEADYRRVRKFETELRVWLDANTGWRLTVDTSAARLHKRRTGDDPTRGLVDGQRRLFTRRRYVLLALSLAVLERSGGQVTLGRLADDVIGELGDPRFAAAGLEFTLGGRDERSDIVAVVRVLLSIGALRRVEGDEERFVDASVDVLYDIEHGIVGVMLQSAQAPSGIGRGGFEGRLAAVTEQQFVDTDDARNRSLRRILTRRLLDDPVVEYTTLTENESAYMANQRRAITDRITDATGLVAEVRAEGIAMLDPEDGLTDVRMPEGGAPGHLALLVATRLASEGRMTQEAVVSYVSEMCETNATIWGSTIQSRPRSELAQEAVSRLRALSLVSVGADSISAHPALSRFRLGTARVSGGVS
ncbi:TIGR02678 family protein [Glaciihabitans sp. UYNi722]|uniref:TIGR02678 family protein n=1 Tax=Glaciihabitans sp. UYNi722 TaxID=3156344 RepID=UPI0033970771